VAFGSGFAHPALVSATQPGKIADLMDLIPPASHPAVTPLSSLTSAQSRQKPSFSLFGPIDKGALDFSLSSSILKAPRKGDGTREILEDFFLTVILAIPPYLV